ncbi:MAG: NFACT RNA binding domain-containing protein [Erysipelotrichaceae bacterium]
MAIDGIILNKINEDLKSKLPARVNKIHQVSTNEILMNLRLEGINRSLIISTHSIYNRIHFTNHQYPTGNQPTQFLMSLRKHLEGGTIYSIEQGGLDRYIIMEVAHRNEIKDKEIIKIYVELMGKYANIILVNEENKIIDALKKIPPFENTKRTIQRGAVYTLPQIQDKKDPFTCFDIDPSMSLTSQFHGFSPLLSKEIEYRMLEEESFKQIMEEIKSSNALYVDKQNTDFFHLIPLHHMKDEFMALNIHEAFDYIYFLQEEKDRIKQVTGDLFKFVRRNIKQLSNKLPKLLVSLDEACDCEKWKTYGELLYTHQIQDTKGQKSITLEDYEGNLVEIPLDSRFNGKQNAARHFNKYQKGKKGQSHLLEQIELCEKEIDYFQSIEEQLSFASFEDAKEIREDLVLHKYLRPTTKQNTKAKKKPLNIQSFIFKDQMITFGKNNLQNDYVTFKLARKSDTWFHAKDYHGAHVIVNNDQPDEDTIRACAQIAAFYSKGRLSSSVPVNYCLAKNLKKIPGSKIGLVQLTQYKTIYIDPTQEDVNLLMQG